MNKKFFYFILTAAIFAATVTSCDPDDDKDSRLSLAEQQRDAIVNRLETESDLSEFVDALKELNLSNLQANELTIFAINNENMPKSALKQTDNDNTDFVLARHVVREKYLNLTDSLKMQALDGSELLVTVTGGKQFVNGVEISRNITAGASVVYVVGAILPETAPQGQSAFEDQNTVYVAGREGNRAVLWINGTPQYLTNGEFDANASSVFVTDNGTVYVAGWEENENKISVGTLWIDSVAKRFTFGDFPTSLSAVHVSDGDVYVAGSVVQSQTWPLYWKNDNVVLLETWVGYSTPTRSIFASEGKVYVTGNTTQTYYVINLASGFESVPLFWNNSVSNSTSNADIPASYSSVFVSEGDVYIGGMTLGGAMLLKNGTPQAVGITGNRAVTSVFVSGNDWYVTARHSSVRVITRNPSYDLTANVNGAWVSKNGNAERLDISSNRDLILAGANSVYVVGNDVYVAGDVDDVATLWRNSEQYMIGDQTAKGSVASSIFVRPKQ